uniref:Uncharacterized protein n=1 Tax=Arundo donax TaxID=35708 RepID=A0A0A8XYE4_ARUDO
MRGYPCVFTDCKSWIGSQP